MKTSLKDKASFVCVRGPIFLFRVNPLPIYFSSVSWYLLDSLLCILFFREKPPPHGPVRPELQTGSSTPKGIPTGRGERLQAGRMEVEIATGINRFQIRYLYQLLNLWFLFGTFIPESRIAVGKSLIAKLLCCFLNCLHHKVLIDPLSGCTF